MPEVYVRSLTTLGEVIGRSVPTVTRWQKRKRRAAPGKVEGKGYPVLATMRWARLNLGPQRRDKSLPTDEELIAFAKELGHEVVEEERGEEVEVEAPRPEPKADEEASDDDLEGLGEEELSRQELLAKVRDKRESARARALKNAELRGELIPLEEVKSRDLARIKAVRQALLALPKAMAIELQHMEPAQIQAVLEVRMRDVLEDFVKMSIPAEE